MSVAQTASAPHASPPGVDSGYWRQHFRGHLQSRLAWATALIRQQPASHSERHIRSYLSLLQQAHAFRELDDLALHLITTLHPWPQRWGEWEIWESELRFAVRACASLARPLEEATFLIHLAERLTLSEHMGEADALAQRALALARCHRSSVLLAKAGVALMTILDLLSNYDAEHALLQALEGELKAWAPSVSQRDLAEALAILGLPRMSKLRRQGLVGKAVELADGWIEDLKRFDDPDLHLMGELHENRGLMLWVQVRYEEARRDLEQAMALYEQAGDAAAEISAQGILGLVQWSLAELDAAEHTFHRNIAYDKRTNSRWRLTRDMGNLALVAFSRGEIEQALARLDHHEALAQELDDAWELHRVLGHRAEVQLCLGQAAEALMVLQNTYDYGQQHGSREGYGLDCLALGLCHLQLGHRELARQLYEEALTLSHTIGSPALQTLALRYLATEVGAEQGWTHLQQALELARATGRRLDVALTLLTMAHVAATAELRDECWRLGVGELEAIGATGWLKEASPEHLPWFPPLL